MREIKWIVIHCTATPQNTTIDSIKRYWREVLKWKSFGYHWILEASGKRHQLAKDEQICNGVAGHNKGAIHISYIGGLNSDDRTREQKQGLVDLVVFYKRKYPNAKVRGHRDFPNVSKACPQFDAIFEYKDLR